MAPVDDAARHAEQNKAQRQRDALARRCALRFEETVKLRAELAAAVTLIRDLSDPDPCWFDHHGGCQAHGYLSLEPGEKCPQAEARELLVKHFADNRSSPSAVDR